MGLFKSRPESFSLDDLKDEDVECIPCLELLRKLDADLAEYDQFVAARRRRILGYVALGVGVIALAGGAVYLLR